MRAVQVTEERGLAEAELPDPEPGPGQVTLEVAFCGICGSDLHMLPSPAISPGTVMGHEFSGRIAAVGEGVEGWQAGDRVCALPGDALRGVPQLPRRATSTSASRRRCAGTGWAGAQGAYAERIVVDPWSLFRLPDEISDEHGALVEPLAVGRSRRSASGVAGGRAGRSSWAPARSG